MLELKLRKIVVKSEETHQDMGRTVTPPSRKVAVAAVIANPFAGRYEEDLSPLFALGNAVAALLVERAVAALGVPAAEITGYGKAAIVGTDGEIEHAAALIHPKFGAPVREAVAGKDIIPSTKKIGVPGAPITVPLTGKTSIWSFDDMDAIELDVPDAPRADEVVVILALAAGGRPLHRVTLS